MIYRPQRILCVALMSLAVLVAFALTALPLLAQNPELQQKVEQIKQAAAMNKQMLAQYTWNETVTISLKGEEKKQEHFQVQLGPDGKPQKTSLDAPASDGSGKREGRLKKHIVEKKTEEYKDYADSIKDLIQQYVPPEKDMLAQAYQKGNILVGPVADVPGQYRLVISNYIKQGDNMTLIADQAQKDLVSLTISTYLSDPSDAVKVTVTFVREPNGPNHTSSQVINGVSKQLTIAIQDSNYQKM